MKTPPGQTTWSTACPKTTALPSAAHQECPPSCPAVGPGTWAIHSHCMLGGCLAHALCHCDSLRPAPDAPTNSRPTGSAICLPCCPAHRVCPPRRPHLVLHLVAMRVVAIHGSHGGARHGRGAHVGPRVAACSGRRTADWRLIDGGAPPAPLARPITMQSSCSHRAGRRTWVRLRRGRAIGRGCAVRRGPIGRWRWSAIGCWRCAIGRRVALHSSEKGTLSSRTTAGRKLRWPASREYPTGSANEQPGHCSAKAPCLRWVAGLRRVALRCGIANRGVKGLVHQGTATR